MSHRKILIGYVLSAVMGLTAAYAQNKPAAPAGACRRRRRRPAREADLQAAR